MPKTKQLQTVVYITAQPTISEVKFPSNTQLNGKKLIGVIAGTSYSGLDPKTPDGKPLLNPYAAASAYVTFKENNSDVIESIPVRNITNYTMTTQGATVFFPLNVENVDFDKCSVKFSNPAYYIAGEVLELHFLYE